MSFWESPCAAKREVRLARPDVGGGMLLLAPLRLAVRESLRPTFTSQLGPPSCTIKCTYMQILSIVVTVSFPIIISKCLGTYDNDAVPCSDGEDVGTGDDAGADLLDGGLDGVDDLEPSHGLIVGVGHLLALEAGRVVQQQRGVAALDEAVVEEEAQDGGAQALLPGDGRLHHRLDGVVQAGAGAGVEARGQLRRRGAGHQREE